MSEILIRGSGIVSFSGPDPKQSVEPREIVVQEFQCPDIIVTTSGVVTFTTEEENHRVTHVVPVGDCYVGITDVEFSLGLVPAEPQKFDCPRCKDDPTLIATWQPARCPKCGRSVDLQ